MSELTEVRPEARPVAGRLNRVRLIGRSLGYFFVHDVAAALLAIVIAIGVWWLATQNVDQDWLPQPGTVFSRCSDLLGDPQFRHDLQQSLIHAAIGFSIATLIGTISGVAMGLSRYADQALRYHWDLLLVIPPAAVAPILVVVVGLSDALTIIMSTLFAVSVIAISTTAAVKAVDRSLLEVSLVFGAKSAASVVRTTVIPAMSPQYFAGLHLGMARAMKGMIVGQVVVGVVGIGAYEARFQQVFDSAGVWSIAVMLIGCSLVMTWVVRAADSVLNYWAYRS